MGEHVKVKIDPEQLKEAETLWGNFIAASKISIAAIATALILLAALFV